ESSHRWPQVLPSGKAALFLACTIYGGSMDPCGIAVVSLKDRHTKIVLKQTGTYARYLTTGHLLYVTKGSLFGIPFDAERLEVRGVPALLGEVSSNPSLASAQYDVSQNGTIAFLTGVAELRTVEWLESAGRTESLVSEPALYAYPRFSPDGARLAV